MAMQIESGGTFPYKMDVSSSGRALVEASTSPALTEFSKLGNSYCISSEEVALTTTASYSGILQIKNTSIKHMHIAIFCLGGDMASAWWSVVRNPGETGTLWSAGTLLSPNNINFSSGNIFPALDGAKKGADGATQVGGVTLNHFPVGLGEFTKELNGAIILGPGNSIAFMCKPVAAGTVHASCLVYFED